MSIWAKMRNLVVSREDNHQSMVEMKVIKEDSIITPSPIQLKEDRKIGNVSDFFYYYYYNFNSTLN